MSISSESGPGEVTVDRVEHWLPRYDEYSRPFGSVFNLHPDYSSIFVGGFPSKTRIQDDVRSTFMIGQIEGLRIGGKDIGLWNYQNSNSVSGAPGRNKFKEKPKKGRRFSGNGYLALDRNNFIDMNEELSIKLRFKPDESTGLILLAGDVNMQHFVAIEFRNQYIKYSFDLGSGAPAEIQSDRPYELDQWHSLEISRNGKIGQLTINNELIGEAESGGDETRLSVTGDIYIGGYPGDIPYYSVQSWNYTGCIEEVSIGLDRADLSNYNSALNVKEGCQVESENLVHFPAANPGYVQLESQSMPNSVELSFMFKTGQKRGTLFYLYDTVGKFYYISLSLSDGALELRVFPDYEISTNSESNPNSYNDNEWHTVTLLISQTDIQLHADDYDYLK